MGSREGAPAGDSGAIDRSQRTREHVERLRRKALEGLERPLTRARAPWPYRFGLVAATCATIAVPVLYAAIVASIGWATTWYALHVHDFMRGYELSGWLWLLIHFGPPIVGLILFGFLLKPFLARPARRPRAHALDPRQQPFLFEHLRRISASVGAPMPRSVTVDLELNAGAGFESGFMNVFDGRMRLNIGLPLVSTLRFDELTAVLVHEFGHLSQGAGMRSYYLMASVTAWLERVVFRRDAWDEWLEEASSTSIGWLGLVIQVARGGVWLSRHLLLVLMKIAAAAAGALSRQMEFDADRNAVMLCGTDAFVRLIERLPVGEVGLAMARAANEHAWSEGRLADDFPLLVRRRLERVPQSLRDELRSEAGPQTGGMYATHPAPRQRVARARALGAPNAIAVDAPGALLFHRYGELCRELTAEGYRASLGPRLKRAAIVPADEVHARMDEGSAALARAGGYFCGVPIGPKSLNLEPRAPRTIDDRDAALGRLRAVRAAIPELVAGMREQAEAVARTQEQLVIAIAGADLHVRRLAMRDPRFTGTPGGARRLAQETEERLEAEQTFIEPFAAAMRERITLALDLLPGPGNPGSQEGAEDIAARGERVLAVFWALRDVSEQIAFLRRRVAVLEVLRPQLVGQEEEGVTQLVRNQARALSTALRAVHEAGSSMPYPFEHARPGLTVGDYLVRAVPTSSDVEQVSPRVAQTLHAWDTLVGKTLAEIAEVGLAAERHLGLAPVDATGGAEEPLADSAAVT